MVYLASLAISSNFIYRGTLAAEYHLTGTVEDRHQQKNDTYFRTYRFEWDDTSFEQVWWDMNYDNDKLS